jgi:NDP-sugar pyrophosphorylase family protein
MSKLNSDRLSTILMAGGYGSRLREITGNHIPKPLVKINNKTLLEHSVDPFIRDSQRIIIFLSFMARSIIDYFGVNSSYEYEVHEEPTGIIREIQETIKSKNVTGNVAIVEGDSIRYNFDASSLYQFHKKNNANITVATTNKPLTNPDNYFGVEIDTKTREILRIHEPNDGTENPYPMIAVAILSPLAVQTFLEIHDVNGSWSTFLPILRKLGGFYANIQSIDYFNVNSPDIYEKAEIFFKEP